jgi:hypothetical protein
MPRRLWQSPAWSAFRVAARERSRGWRRRLVHADEDKKAVYDQFPDASKKLSWLARYTPSLLESPIPGDNRSSTTVVPNGNLASFKDRWQWIDDSMLPAWKRLSERDPNEVRRLMQEFLKGKYTAKSR